LGRGSQPVRTKRSRSREAPKESNGYLFFSFFRRTAAKGRAKVRETGGEWVPSKGTRTG